MKNERNYSLHTVAKLIEMFNMCPQISETDHSVFESGFCKGIIIDPKCANAYSKAYLENISIQYNNTFYKTWGDVTSKDRFTLFVDQVLHYFTMNCKSQYVPNVYIGEPEWNSYKIINACTFDEMYDKCMNMLVSGIALKSDVVDVITDFMITYCNINNYKPVIDHIKNREALVILCKFLNILPENGNKLFAYIIYKMTGLTMIVKNRETRDAISRVMTRSNRDISMEMHSMLQHLTNDQMIALAGVFNRYKPLFLAMKGNNTLTNRVINKISRLSKQYHVPMIRGFWETALENTNMHTLKEAMNKVKVTNNFKLIQVMQSIRERILLASGMGDNLYVIRNGKIFIKDNDYKIVDSRYQAWDELYKICKKQLIKNLSKKKCTVKFPTKYELACPTSEKNFIGDLPMGTSCSLENDAIFGIYWKEAWGTRDFDLSFNDITGNRIGWNASYGENNDEGMIYSGDLTRAQNGANEVMYIKENCPDGIIYVNRYCGEPNSKFKLFFGVKGDRSISDFTRDNLQNEYCMVNPNDISLETMVNQGDMSQMMVGCILDGRVHFINFSCGYSAVASSIRKMCANKNLGYDAIREKTTQGIVEILKRKAYAALSVKDILIEAGFKHVETDAELDLTDLNHSTLIELFS